MSRGGWRSVLIRLAALTGLLLPHLADTAPRLPSAKRECALCHVMWLTDFKRDDVTPLIPYDPKPVVASGRQDVSSTERMCLSCHDGWVLESRDLWKNKAHAHPVGQKPSKDIHIPVVDGKNLFPLNHDGKMYCGTCHSAHGVEWGNRKSPVFMRVPSRDGELCQACHDTKTHGPSAGFHPIGKKPEKRPALLDTSDAKLSNAGEITCQSCHSPHLARQKKLLVVKNDRSQLCAGCHDDRAANNLAEAARLRTHPVNVVPRQARVPEELKKHGSRLGPDGSIICETCHKPHKARPGAGLLVADNAQSALCESCHRRQKRIDRGKHDMRLVKAGSTNIRKQSAAEGGSCSACHVPHRGKGPRMWAREPGNSKDPMAALCLSCHDRKGLASKHRVGRYSHPVGVDIRRLGRRVPLPTFSPEGLKSVNAASGLVSCASCHDPHQWDPAHPDRNARPGDPGDGNNSFLRKANGPDSALCRTCHKEKWLVRDSEHDMARMAPESRNALGQTPRQSGLCGSCHQVHNGTGPRMWARALPGNASPYAAPCLSCHNPDGVAADKLVGTHSHPIGAPIADLGIRATLDRWTSKLVALAGVKSLRPLPLFNRHGERADKDGRVGCASCHDPHRWSPDNSARAFDVEGDAGNSFLRIAEHGNSDLCVNCHNDKAAVARSQHAIREPGADTATEIDSDTEPASPKGVCATCHQPHNARDDFLWARKDGPGENRAERRCTACHRKDGLAGKKLTGRYTHPLGVEVAATRSGKLPLYDAGGRHTDGNGKVGCGSCHDPHQWKADDIFSRAGQKPAAEGDATDSFLRVSAGHGELCGECHKEKTSVRGSDHDLAVTAPSSTDSHGKSPKQAGLCGSCHSVHNATAALRLWARALPETGKPVERTCRSCHRAGGVASKKIPVQAEHPDKVTAWSQQLRQGLRPASRIALPVFDEQGHPDTTGKIDCATCHDAHQWDAGHPGPGPGRNTEGDAANSFLRLPDSRAFLCADCHGLDSLYRYKYFHADKAHVEHPLAR